MEKIKPYSIFQTANQHWFVPKWPSNIQLFSSQTCKEGNSPHYMAVYSWENFTMGDFPASHI
jgi:hypothetical protein